MGKAISGWIYITISQYTCNVALVLDIIIRLYNMWQKWAGARIGFFWFSHSAFPVAWSRWPKAAGGGCGIRKKSNSAPPADRPAYRSPAVRFMICFFLEGMPLIILCNLSNNTKVCLYHCHLARSRLKSRIIYFNWRIHLQFSCIIDSFYAKVLT